MAQIVWPEQARAAGRGVIARQHLADAFRVPTSRVNQPQVSLPVQRGFQADAAGAGRTGCSGLLARAPSRRCQNPRAVTAWFQDTADAEPGLTSRR
jgi:hypothetical protein